jgi:hypothetical protein
MCSRQQHGLKPALDGTVTLEKHVVLELFGNQKATQTLALKRAAAPCRSCDVLQSIRFGDAAVPCRHRRDQIIAHAFIETDQALWRSWRAGRSPGVYQNTVGV